MVFRVNWAIAGRASMMVVLMAVLALSATIGIAGVNEDLINAAWRNDLSEVKRLLAAGAEVNAESKDGDTALIIASENGNIEMVKALIDKGANFNPQTIEGFTALIAASIKGYRQVVELLLTREPRSMAKIIWATPPWIMLPWRANEK